MLRSVSFFGFMNLIPYLGSFLAMIPAVLIALATSPKMLVAVLIVFALEQFIEGRFVSPLVLGSQLDIHPCDNYFCTIDRVEIIWRRGSYPWSTGYAAIKVVVTHIFEWYKAYSAYIPKMKYHKNMWKCKKNHWNKNRLIK